MSLNLDKSTWERVQVGDVVSNVNITVKDPESAGINRVIAMEHLDPGELKIQRWGSLADGTTFTRRVKPGQTLFGKRRAYQRKVAYADFDAICSGDILVFEANSAGLLPELLPFLVQSDGFFDHALGTSAGSLSPRTNWRDLSNYEFLLPGLDDQKRIADLLWAVERDAQASRCAAARLARVEAAWASNLGTASHSATPLGELLTAIIDRRGITPRKLGEDFTESGVRVVSAMNVVDGLIDYSRQERFVSERVGRRWMSGPLESGDILMTSEAPLGSLVLLAETTPVCLGQRLFGLRPDQKRVLPTYLYAWLRSESGQAALEARASGTTVRGIRQAELVKIQVPLPNIPDQQDFVRHWEGIRIAGSELLSRLDATARLRSSLLADIFGGD